jgi:hypothetical protein
MRDNTKVTIKDIGWEDVGWIHLAQRHWWALTNTAMNHRAP